MGGWERLLESTGLRRSFLKTLQLSATDSDEVYGFHDTLPPKGLEGLGEPPLQHRTDPASSPSGLIGAKILVELMDFFAAF